MSRTSKFSGTVGSALRLVWLAGGLATVPALACAQAAGDAPAAAESDTLAIRPISVFAGEETTPPGPLWSDPDPSVPIDLAVARRVRSAGVQRSAWARGIADVAEFAAIPGTGLLAAALYGIGELDDDPAMRDLGLHSGQAVVVAGVVSLLGKVAVGRERPRISPDDPYRLGLGDGLRGDDYQSFPSAHTAAAFASAVVLSRDLAERNPGSGLWLIPTSYGAAALAGLSRIYEEHHWASDVAIGAIIGALSGWGVAEFHDARN